MFQKLQYIIQSENSHHAKNSDVSYIIKNILLKKMGMKERHTDITSCRNMKASIPCTQNTHDCQLTVKWGFPGWIFSSFRTQIPFVNFRDWYNMSWPSTFRFAIVNTLFCCIFWTTASVQNTGSVNNYCMCTVLQYRSSSLRQINLPQNARQKYELICTEHGSARHQLAILKI